MARKTSDVSKFHRRQQVVAVSELAGVPAGTIGVVYYEAGLRWFRYHVAFDNGVELANVDGNDLVSLDEWRQREVDRHRADLAAEREKRRQEMVASLRAPGGH